ncbi:permease [Thermodesulfobacteriota bacterium]
MKKMDKIACSCSPENSPIRNSRDRRTGQLFIHILFTLLIILGWYAVYSRLQPLSRFLTYQVAGLEAGSHFGAAIEFFLYDTPKVLMLLTIVVFGVGIIRTYFTPERTRNILAGKRESTGNVLAALLGIVTPFCSCSAVPLFIGFVTAGVPLGVTLSFLIAAPMVNEIALILLYGLLGWKIAALYLGTGLGIAILSGWVIGRLGMENHIEGWVREMQAQTNDLEPEKLSFNDRLASARAAVRDIVGKVWLYVVVGIGVGAAIHGYVPEGFMASIMGKGAWWSVPVAVLVGIPMYSNAAGIVPVIHALLEKGAALGTVLAFMMSVIALSLPEMVILRKVLKPRLIGVFIAILGTGILLVGTLFNIII